MKSPVILMNETDFNNFKNGLEFHVNNFETGDNPAYEGIPIKIKDFVEKGNIFIYDDTTINWL